MKVKVAETAGFCFGVKRAVDKVYELIDTEQKPIFTLGPIIHNEEVVADLEAKGIHVITEENPRRRQSHLRQTERKRHLLRGCHLSLRTEDPQDRRERKSRRKSRRDHR